MSNARSKQAAKNGVRAIAGALGIQRHELGAFTQMKGEPPKLFPIIGKSLIPSVEITKPETDILEHRCNIQEELIHYFTSLETNSFVVKDDPITHRYSDDFVQSERKSFVPSMCDLPKSLYPPAIRKRLAAKEREAENAKKAKKMEQLFNDLLAKEKEGNEKSLDAPEEEAAPEDEEEEPVLEGSEEELFEEDNDYIHAYFDNGEGYNENPSDDNLEDGDY